MTTKEALEAFHKRPALYWGNSDHLFTSWIAFTCGFLAGQATAFREGAIKPSDLVPEDFNKFVTERFGETFPAGGRGWMILIREHTSSEQEAFDLFFQLREEYDRAKEC